MNTYLFAFFSLEFVRLKGLRKWLHLQNTFKKTLDPKNNNKLGENKRSYSAKV
jgi:hypothetical protein